MSLRFAICGDMRFALATLVIFLATSASAQKVAVLPLQPHKQAKVKQADWIEGKMLRQLRVQGASLITGDAVVRAMKDAGAKDTVSCDTACLLKIGKALGVDRVLAPELSLQKKEQSIGVVWIWTTRQVHVAKAVEWGTFTRMCMCAKKTWDAVTERQVTRMLTFDPSKRVRLPDDAPRAQITKGPREEPGMVFVPAGPFVMGADFGEFDEEPRHLVQLDAYFMDKTEVTNAAYSKCVEAGGCRKSRYWYDKTLNQPTHPVVAVGWDDGVRYCKWAGKHLPTEAEWEKAARGTDERIFPWGSDFRESQVNMHHKSDGWPTTAPVGTYPQNVSPYGALDMAGNAWEWTADYWSSVYYR
ncbi:MAG: sulfatase activating formylglycine-generating enzyme, partial [Myxococcota bacterium]